MLEMRNKSSEVQQENAKTSMQHCGLSTSPHNVKERMQSGFLHPVHFPTSQYRVKVCTECVCVYARVRVYATGLLRVFSLSRNYVVSALFHRNAILQNLESRSSHKYKPQRKHPVWTYTHLHMVLISITHDPIRSVYRSNSSVIQSLNETILHL